MSRPPLRSMPPPAPVRALHLGLWIPVLLALAFAGLAGAWAYLEDTHLRSRHQREQEQRWREDLARLKPQLERLLLQGHRAAAEELVASYASDPSLKALAVTDPREQVLLANREGWRGRPASEVLPGFRVGEARAARQAGRLRLAPRGDHLEAYLPVTVAPSPEEPREPYQGLIYLSYDLRPGLAEARSLLGQELRSLLPAAVLALGLAWFFFHRYLRRPLRILEAHTRELATGRFRPVPVRGEGELARLARAFTEMGQRLERTLARLRREEARYRGVLQALQDGVFLARDGRYVDANEAFFRLLGRPREEVLGRPIGSFSPPAQPDGAHSLERAQHLVRQIMAGRPASLTWTVQRPDGTLVEVEVNASRLDLAGEPHLVASVRDVTERRRIQKQVERLAYYDPLSGLANRRLLLDRLRQALARLQREGQGGAVLFIDLDRFKPLNDALGHRAGDRVLQETARRVQALLREVDTVARLGGDEFVVLLPALGREPGEIARGALRAAERIRAALQEGYGVDGHRFHLGASIGVALFPQDGLRPEELLHHADAAMYRAKARGRGSIAFYHPSFQEEADERLALEQGLRAALESSEGLHTHYQLQVDREGRVVATEALARWRHPKRGWIPSARFVAVAEDCGLILPLGRRMLEEALAQCAAWRRAGWEAPQVAVNVSPVQFRQADFVEEVAERLRRHGLPPGTLTLEITERLLVEDAEETAARLRDLKALGVRLSVDDFGTGYSSLAYLTRLPLDELKIDRAFVGDLGRDPDDEAIVVAVLSMARHLGLTVVAEGVETPAQAAFLQAHGCQRFQGFLYARPAPAEALARRLPARGLDQR